MREGPGGRQLTSPCLAVLAWGQQAAHLLQERGEVGAGQGPLAPHRPAINHSYAARGRGWAGARGQPQPHTQARARGQGQVQL